MVQEGRVDSQAKSQVCTARAIFMGHSKPALVRFSVAMP